MARLIQHKQIECNDKKGTIHCRQLGSVFCKKYVGKFHTEPLRLLADIGLWYVKIQGLPESIQGEGHTPVLSIQDAISRNRQMIQKLEQANQALESVLPTFLEDEKGSE